MSAVEEAKAALKTLSIETLWKVHAKAVEAGRTKAQSWIEDEIASRKSRADRFTWGPGDVEIVKKVGPGDTEK